MPCYYLYKNKWHSEESITNILKDGELRELIEKNILFPKTPITAPKTVPEKTQKEEPKKEPTKKTGDLQVNDVVLYDGEPYRIYKINSKNSFDLSNGQGGWILDASPKDKEWGGATDIKLSVPQRIPTTIDKETYNSLLEQLDESIKGVLGGVLRGKEFASKLKEQSGREIRDTKGTVYGFVGKDGKVYLNGEKINANTPIHEYGHVWINAVKKFFPHIYNKGLEIADKTKYVAELLKKPAYKEAADAYRKGNKTALLEEALAMAIGDRGEMIVNSANKKRFKEWLRDFWNSVKEFFGGKLTDLTPEQVQNLKPLEFIELAAGQLVGGERVFDGGTTADAQLQSKESYIQVGDKNISLTKLKEYGDQVNTGRSLLKRLSPDYEQGRNRGGQALIEATILTRAVQEAVRKPKKGGADNLFTKREEATALEQYARQEGIWVDNTDKKYPQYDDNGQEQKVYFNPDDNTVTKVNSGAYSKNTWLDLFDRIAVHNTVFPMSAYEVVGFGRDKDGAFQVILKQPFIRGSATTVDKVAEHMTKMGFEPIPGKKLGKEEYRGKNGIIIYDLHGGNVLVTEEGNIVVFDPLIDFSEYNLGEIDLSPLDETQLQSINGTDAERAQIEAQAKKDGTWMKAPNGKPTNLNEQQWVTVRTKAFKNWFGDFELVELEKKIKNNRSVIAPNLVWHGGKIVGDLDPLYGDFGINFGTREQAESRGKTKTTKVDVVPYIINLKKPITLYFDMGWWNNLEAWKDLGYLPMDYNGNVLDGLKQQGYDGIIYPNETEGNGQSYIAFYSKGAQKLSEKTANVSKVVDANGEPMPVWHAGNKNITEFDQSKRGQNKSYGKDLDIGFFFGDKKTSELFQRSSHISQDYEVFLNLRNPYYVNVKQEIREAEADYDNDILDIWRGKTGETLNSAVDFYDFDPSRTNDGVIDTGSDGFIIEGVDGSFVYNAISPNQIKLADGTNTTFDPNSNDIRFMVLPDGRRVRNKVPLSATEDVDRGSQIYLKPDGPLKEQRLEERRNSAAARVERARVGLIEAYGEWIAPGAINDPLKNWDSTRKLIGRLLEYAIARGIQTKEQLVALVKEEIKVTKIPGYEKIEEYILKAVLRGLRAYDKSDSDTLNLTDQLADLHKDIHTAPEHLYRLYDDAESSERKAKILKFINVMLTQRQEYEEHLTAPNTDGLADFESRLTEELNIYTDPDLNFGRRDQTNWATSGTEQAEEAALKPNTEMSINYAFQMLSAWHAEYRKHGDNSTEFVRLVADWLSSAEGERSTGAGSIRAGLKRLVEHMRDTKHPNTPFSVFANMEKIIKEKSRAAEWATRMGAAFASLQRKYVDRHNTAYFGLAIEATDEFMDAMHTIPTTEHASDIDNHDSILQEAAKTKGKGESRAEAKPKPSHRRQAKQTVATRSKHGMQERINRIKDALKNC